MYRSEYWANIRKRDNKINVVEIKMLTWMCVVTKINRIRNEYIIYIYTYIRGIIGVTNIVGKMRENRMRWFGRVHKRNNENIFKKIGKIRV